MARGRWTTSFADRAKAQYAADQIVSAQRQQQQHATNREQEAYRQGWIDGCHALLAQQEAERRAG